MNQDLGNNCEGDLGNLKDWTSDLTTLAMHSDNQDVIVDYLRDRFNFESNLTWSLMRRTCIPLWLKDSIKLNKLLEMV